MADSVVAEDDAPQSLSKLQPHPTPNGIQIQLQAETARQQVGDGDDDELRRLLLPDVSTLPLSPPSVAETNFARFYAPDLMKPGHDHYVYRHANGLCVIGIAPTHVALKAGGVTSVDFNVGKSDRSEFKVTGKRKRNAQHFQSNSILCNIISGDTTYAVRCGVKGSLLEVNNRLIQNPGLLNTSADREGYIAIIMPKPTDWPKIKESLVTFDEYKELRKLS